MYWVYMLKDIANNLYIGITKDVEKRLAYHNQKRGALFTKHGSFRIVFAEKHVNIAAARNTGVRISKGDILIFIDSDTIIVGNLFNEMEEAFRDLRVVGVTPKTVPDERTGKSMFIIYLMNLLVRTSMHFRRALSFTYCTACKRDAFLKIGGFNENMYSVEDWQFSLRLNKLGKYKFLKNLYAVTSMRRLQKWGFIYTVYRYLNGSGLLGKKKTYDRVD